MSDRKAVNRYYPPDFDPQKHKSINKYRNSHPLRERAKKLSQGILVIRFEMPYNIWCDGCGNHVGMGVRYNAEKKKVGNYYTTPIYQFRMKCHLCDNYYVIETDPQNCDYKIIEGARRKNQKWDMADNEQVLTEDREVIKKRSRDPMYKLEHGVEDGKKLKAVIPSLSQIEDMQETWRDDYMQNKMLRNKFREEKKALKVADEEDQALLAKSSLDITLVEEHEDDKKLAKLMKYNAVESFDDKQKHTREAIKNRPLFTTSKSSSAIPKAAASSPTSLPTGINGSSNLEDIQKRLGLNKLKTSKRTAFGDFDSPVKKRMNKSSTNLGLVVVKKKKTSHRTDSGSISPESLDSRQIIESNTRTNVQDLITGDSNSNTPDTSRTSHCNSTILSIQDQALKSNEVISVTSVGSLGTNDYISSLGSNISDMSSNNITSKRSLLLCDYTSSSESD